MAKHCTHLDQIENVKPQTPDGCEECLKSGDPWVHLRMCLVCGHIGCCDSSKNTHATKHFKATKHPVIQAYKSGDEWEWCYIDEMYIEE